MRIDRLVVDTNVVVSAALVDDSAPARLVDYAAMYGRMIGTDETTKELVSTLLSSKFHRFAPMIRRETFLQRLEPLIEIVPVIQRIKACRDPRDDKFLEAAVNGRADVIISGDKDLLVLHPFRGIAILSPSHYLARVAEDAE